VNSNRKVAVVTGGGRGIGKAVAVALARAGNDIVLAEINLEVARAAAIEIEQYGGAVLAHATDVSKRASVEGLVEATLERFGRLDVLVNNAAVIAPASSLEMTDEQWDMVINVDLKGVFLCSQLAARQMVVQRSGSIINIASIAAERGIRDRANYCVAKAGVVALTRVMGLELASAGVRVNAVGPGYVNTELQQAALAQGINSLEKLTGATPMGRLAEPAEIANVVAFLASDQASYITGQVIFADGGWLAGTPG
jgi:glucose 1-dehydrogenase